LNRLKEQHIQLVKMYFHLITSENLDPHFIMVFCSTFARLMRFPALISRKELEFDWRAMHKLYKYATHNPKANRMLIIFPYRFASSVKAACRVARRYYPGKLVQIKVVRDF
jgi:hypothetical protein